MIKLKGLKKKLLRLEASMQKDARRLAKLKRKIETALRVEPAKAKVESPVRTEGKAETASKAAPPAKKKNRLSPAARAKLSAMMKARWAAKKANAGPAREPQRLEG
jgi:hypothetical protein